MVLKFVYKNCIYYLVNWLSRNIDMYVLLILVNNICLNKMYRVNQKENKLIN